jgi:signal transduction histidine kinase
MQQVVLNLATNARRHAARRNADGETANLDVEATTVVGDTAIPPGSWVTLAVTDTGQGMDRELQERVFEPFFTTKDSSADGLGLSSVYGSSSRAAGS